MTATATDLAAFVAAVLADPDDPGPRLILADWMEESDVQNRVRQSVGPVLREEGRWLLINSTEEGATTQHLCWAPRPPGSKEAAPMFLARLPEPILCQQCQQVMSFFALNTLQPATQRLYGEWRCQEHTDPRRLADVPWQHARDAWGLREMWAAEVVLESAAEVTWSCRTDQPVCPDGGMPPDGEWVRVPTVGGGVWLFPRLHPVNWVRPSRNRTLAQEAQFYTSDWRLASIGPFYRIGADGTLTRYHRPIRQF